MAHARRRLLAVAVAVAVAASTVRQSSAAWSQLSDAPFVLHAHTAQEECEVVSIVSLQERSKDGKVKTRKRPGFAKSNAVIVARIQVERRTPLAPFSRMPQLGRFTLRDEGRTIAIGKITRVPEAKSSSGGGGGGGSA